MAMRHIRSAMTYFRHSFEDTGKTMTTVWPFYKVRQMNPAQDRFGLVRKGVKARDTRHHFCMPLRHGYFMQSGEPSTFDYEPHCLDF